jgi:hypothetical protein
MSTRSRIGYVTKDGSILSIYCHSDGYVEVGVGVGHQLHTHYNNLAAAKKIVALGDLSSLHPQLVPPKGSSHSFERRLENVTVAYGRDRGESDSKAVKSANIAEFLAIDSGQEYSYLFANGAWKVWGGDEHLGDLSVVLVTEQLTS